MIPGNRQEDPSSNNDHWVRVQARAMWAFSKFLRVCTFGVASF